MKIYEYQAKTLFSRFGIPVERNILCYTPEETIAACAHLNTFHVAVKAQVLAGGRGKAGGVKLAHDPEEVRTIAQTILGMNIKGYTVDQILVSEAINIASEYYLSLTIDRNTKSVILIASQTGGMDIEEVAKTSPEQICRIPVDNSIGMQQFLSNRAGFFLSDDITVVRQTADIIQKLYRLLIETDASLVEINPLALTKERKLIALDAKMTFDENALFRRPEIETLYEPDAEEQKERKAKEKGISYVHLNGNIGCMVNGAGLAMATMDVIKHFGGNPANFLDIGGSSNPQKVVDAMKLLLSDLQVKIVLINIFGGITRCDDVAKGLLEAFRQIEINIPIVLRLTGTNEKEGRELLQNSPFIMEETMEQAAQKAINLVIFH